MSCLFDRFIIEIIETDLRHTPRRGVFIPPLIQFLVFVKFCATGSLQITVGDLNNLSQGTISKIIKRVAISIAKLYKRFIKYPTHEEARLEIRKFYQLSRFPGVVGAIDCTHVKINSPGGTNAELYRCRKSYFSINVQAICTQDLRFTNVVARWYGSAHDSRIFENSKICGKLERAESPGILLGDSGYACTPYLMTPFDRPRTPAQVNYNRSQILARNVIERAFGVLKQRFNCLRHLRVKKQTVLNVIIACFVMHNIAVQFRMEHEEPTEDESDDEDERPEPTAAGLQARLNIVNTHFNLWNM